MMLVNDPIVTIGLDLFMHQHSQVRENMGIWTKTAVYTLEFQQNKMFVFSLTVRNVKEWRQD